jgi:hypothetical protein
MARRLPFERIETAAMAAQSLPFLMRAAADAA